MGNIIDIIASAASVLAFLSIFLFLPHWKEKSDAKLIKEENREIEEKLQAVRDLAEEQTDVVDLMLRNVSELREYYVISKNQAKRSFSAALMICFLGIAIYSFGIISIVFFQTDASLLTLIAGTVVEVISSLFFWLYVQAAKQLDIYHKRLGSTEKYLMAISLTDKMSEDWKDKQYQWIIQNIILMDGETLQNKQ